MEANDFKSNYQADVPKWCFILSIIVNAFIVIFHVFAFVMESLALKSALGRRLFKDLVDNCGTLAANQGVYNLCLAAVCFFLKILCRNFSNAFCSFQGMLWAIIMMKYNIQYSRSLRIYFAATVAIVGFTGGVTFAPSLYAGQMAPGLISLALTAFEYYYVRRHSQ